jgi:sugar O-acyltransferase (sialic acid O-acetyltransferase NeuD family)
LIKVVGIGAGGHAKVLLDILRCASGFEVVGLVDSDPKQKGRLVEGVSVLGGDDVLPGLLREGVSHAFLGVGGVGDNHPRAQLFERLRAQGFHFVKAIHPAAVVAASAEIGEGAAIMAGAVVNPGARLGLNVIVNSGAVVDHDCLLEDHVHIAPGAVLSGGVRVGKYGHVGTGAAVRQGVTIAEGALVGAGAVVVADVSARATVAGNPARARSKR